MKTRSLTLSLAVLMSLQSAAIANTSRTEGIAQAAVQTAKINVAALQSKINILDNALEQAGLGIANKSDSTAQIVAVGAGLAGLALTIIGTLAVSKVGGPTTSGIAVVSAAFAATVTATVANISSAKQVDLEVLKSNLRDMTQETYKALGKAEDGAAKDSLRSVNLSIMAAYQAIDSYERRQDASSEVHLIGALSGLSGIAAYSVGTIVKNPYATAIGMALFGISNVVSAASALTEANSATILEEIKNAREELKALSDELK